MPKRTYEDESNVARDLGEQGPLIKPEDEIEELDPTLLQSPQPAPGESPRGTRAAQAPARLGGPS
jgi:hypothetical protein